MLLLLVLPDTISTSDVEGPDDARSAGSTEDAATDALGGAPSRLRRPQVLDLLRFSVALCCFGLGWASSSHRRTDTPAHQRPRHQSSIPLGSCRLRKRVRGAGLGRERGSTRFAAATATANDVFARRRHPSPPPPRVREKVGAGRRRDRGSRWGAGGAGSWGGGRGMAAPSGGVGI